MLKISRDNYSYYQKGLSRQISLLKSILPSAPILVVGVTDMAVNEGDSIKSFDNIRHIIESQKMASQISGAVFWNSYLAMGGKLSIVKWAEKKPPLAQKDLVHFTYTGADTLSKLLVSSVFTSTQDSSLLIAESVASRDSAVSGDSALTAIPEASLFVPESSERRESGQLS